MRGLEKPHCSGVLHCELKPPASCHQERRRTNGLRAGESASRRSWSESCLDSLPAMLQR